MSSCFAERDCCSLLGSPVRRGEAFFIPTPFQPFEQACVHLLMAGNTGSVMSTAVHPGHVRQRGMP